GRHVADAAVAGVGDHEAAVGGRGDAPGEVELGRRRRAAVAGETGRAAAGDGRDRAGGRDAADAVVVEVGDQEAAVGGRGDAGGGVELGRGRRAAVAGETGRAAAGNRSDSAGGRDTADAVALIGDQEAAVGGRGDAEGVAELRC